MKDSRARLLANMVRHGATQVELRELYKESEIIWQIRPDHEISDACIQLEEFMSSAARNSQSALQVIDRMSGSGNPQDRDLLTALKKYVEDACEAIKVVDNTLKENGATLEALLFEIPNEASSNEVSWRNLIGRRDVIAHRLLSVDDGRVYDEAKRDFGLLHRLLSRIWFVPVKTDLASGKGFGAPLRMDALRKLAPSDYGQSPRIGESLIFICEDKVKGFVAVRLGRTENNKLLIGASFVGSFPFSLHAMELGGGP